MLKNFFKYEYFPVWKDGLSESVMLNKNVFCYGKPNSGKTEKVAIPFLHNALIHDYSAIVLTKNLNEYKEAITYAANRGYNIVYANYAVDGQSDGNFKYVHQLSKTIFEKKTLLLINQSAINDPYSIGIFDFLMFDLLEKDRGNRVFFPMDIHIIIDAPYYNLFSFTDLFQMLDIKICYITDCQLISTRFRDVISKKVIPDKIKNTYEALANEQQVFNLDTLLLPFFFGIEVVICTGITGISPKEHKAFIKQFITTTYPKVAGKYAYIEESPTITSSVDELPNDITLEEIYDKEIEIADRTIQRGNWIIKVDGTIKFVFAECYCCPVFFEVRQLAYSWLLSYLRNQHFQDAVFLNNEYSSVVVQATLPGTTVKTVIEIESITKSNVDTLKDEFLLSALEMVEMDFALTKTSSDDSAEDMALERLSELLDEDSSEDEIINTCPEEYRYKPYTPADNNTNEQSPSPALSLPTDNVLFLGGHTNMTKKLKQIFPNWKFISDDAFKSKSLKSDVVFFWTGHSSHKMTKYVFSRLPENVNVIYLTATNLSLLMQEMQEKYSNFVS